VIAVVLGGVRHRRAVVIGVEDSVGVPIGILAIDVRQPQ
jgi:hypothetical protein